MATAPRMVVIGAKGLYQSKITVILIDAGVLIPVDVKLGFF